MQKAHLIVAALALAASASASAQAETVYRRHARSHATREVLPAAPIAVTRAAPVALSNDPLASALDQISSETARSQAASQTVTTDAFGPVLRLLYPPGQSGDL